MRGLGRRRAASTFWLPDELLAMLRDERVKVTPPAGVDLLPSGQRRVAEALLSETRAPTYPEVAGALRIGVGTVHRHLSRIRARHPELYQDLMAARRIQLDARHREAESRARAHSDAWHRRQSARRFFYRFGRWPWEPRRYR